ncbi:hypothetical protein K501DRAFT_269055 [Backusella circina FSU 941]|nr:hypothetical protein K501DRAFT_269055 [Backusella circina FSU 941]
MDVLEDEFQRCLQDKIRSSISKGADLEVLKQECETHEDLERGTKTNANAAASLKAGAIENILNGKIKTKKTVDYWNDYTKEHFERLIETIQKGEDEPIVNQSTTASSAQRVSTVIESGIKTYSSTFSPVIRKGLDLDIRHHVIDTLQNTLEKTSNYTINYSMQLRKLTLLFTDQRFTISKSKVALEEPYGFDIKYVLPEGYNIDGDVTRVAPSLDKSAFSHVAF